MSFVIDGQSYRFIKQLGSGGFGAVFLMERKVQGQSEKVALKLFFPTSDSRFYFEEERKIMEEIQRRIGGCRDVVLCHEGVITIPPGGEGYRFFSEELRSLAPEKNQNTFNGALPLHGLLTKFIQGRNCYELFQEFLRKRQWVPSKLIQRFMSNGIEALKILHSQGITHHDIKPENIIYDETKGKFVLIDFGLACLETCPYSMAGTPGFIPAETVRRYSHIPIPKNVSENWDICDLLLTVCSLATSENYSPLEGYQYYRDPLEDTPFQPLPVLNECFNELLRMAFKESFQNRLTAEQLERWWINYMGGRPFNF